MTKKKVKKRRSFGNLCLKKWKFFGNLLGKIRIFLKFAWKNLNSLEVCFETSKIFRNWPGDIEIFLTWIPNLQISNLIDAADHGPYKLYACAMVID